MSKEGLIGSKLETKKCASPKFDGVFVVVDK